ncbi:MAG: GTPase Era [Proteobacteria bacterium]|nr:MAG: GTPase Era [Pseudomonadota bacterium]
MDHDSVISGMAALVGPPNAGKSTLLNTLLGQKISIVTPKPQTTRNRIAGVLNEKEYQIVLLDTPGLHRSRSPLNAEMVRIALESLVDVDVVVFMIDVSLPLPEKVKKKKTEEYRSYFATICCPAILLLNKIDLIDREQLLPLIDAYADLFPFKAIIPVSALRGDGTTFLIENLLSFMPIGPRYFPEDIPTDASERFLTAEIIREKLFLQTGQEIPYGSAVMVDSFKQDPITMKVTIHATIYLERKSQKGIVIGRGGSKLRSIGIEARKDIEELLMTKADLRLWVKIKKNWTKNDKFLQELGLQGASSRR